MASQRGQMVSARGFRVISCSRSGCHQSALYSAGQLGRARILDKRTFIGMVEAGEPLIQLAVDAVREYHQAQGRGAPAEEVERLLAESLFQAVSDYQLRVVARARGKNLPPTH